jgi:hypothetical protein
MLSLDQPNLPMLTLLLLVLLLVLLILLVLLLLALDLYPHLDLLLLVLPSPLNQTASNGLSLMIQVNT